MSSKRYEKLKLVAPAMESKAYERRITILLSILLAIGLLLSAFNVPISRALEGSEAFVQWNLCRWCGKYRDFKVLDELGQGYRYVTTLCIATGFFVIFTLGAMRIYLGCTDDFRKARRVELAHVGNALFLSVVFVAFVIVFCFSGWPLTSKHQASMAAVLRPPLLDYFSVGIGFVASMAVLLPIFTLGHVLIQRGLSKHESDSPG